jgi:hypothetical protein
LVKAFTLGAGDFDAAYRVVLKQIMPRVLNSIRLNLKSVMLFLFAGEMIASTDGLAFRIALAAPPHGHGRHHSVRAVGGAAAVPGGFRDARAQSQAASLVPGVVMQDGAD